MVTPGHLLQGGVNHMALIGVYGFQGDVVADQVAQIAADKLHLVSILVCLHEERYDIGASNRGFFVITTQGERPLPRQLPYRREVSISEY